jgi:hypothetical protein
MEEKIIGATDHMDIQKALIDRFGEAKVSSVSFEGIDDNFLLIDLNADKRVRVLVTCGLSDYIMPVPEKLKSRDRAELFFCLPTYWDLEDRNNSNLNWVFQWLDKIKNYSISKETWIGSGHTFSAAKEGTAISETMKQDHFILLDPILLADELTPIEMEGITVHFLAVVPIFSDEWDYKQGKGTVKLMRKLVSKGVTEKLDDFRTTVLKSKWRIW